MTLRELRVRYGRIPLSNEKESPGRTTATSRTLARSNDWPQEKIIPSTPTAKKSSAGKFNCWLAVKITDGVGTMWCAYIFAGVALIELPPALRPGGEGIITWIAQAFLQLVLLSIIIVGQKIAAASSDERSENTFKDAEAILSEAIEIQKHLQSQDEELIKALREALAKVPRAGQSTEGVDPSRTHVWVT